MDHLQGGEDTAVETTKPTTDASPPEEDWVVKMIKPALGGRPQETVAKDLGSEKDLREILGWLNNQGWIVLKQLGSVEHDWDVGQDRYVNRIIDVARLLTDDTMATYVPKKSVSDNAPVSSKLVSLRCVFFAGGDRCVWKIVTTPNETEKQGGALETVTVSGGDVFICHFWLNAKTQPVIDHPEPIVSGNLRSWNLFQNAYFWRE